MLPYHSFETRENLTYHFGANKPAIPVRAFCTDAPLVDYRDSETGFAQIMCAGDADNSATNNEDMPILGRHVRIPSRNGS